MGSADAGAQPAGRPADEAAAAFLAAMGAAGNPGAARTPLAKPGAFGRTRHVHGWVVRPVEREDPEADANRYEPGLFLTTGGSFHRLDSTARGWGQREGLRFSDIVGPEIADLPVDDGLLEDLAALRRAHAG